MGLLRRGEGPRTEKFRRGLRALWDDATDPAVWRRAVLLATLRDGRADPFAVDPDAGAAVISPAPTRRPASRSEA